MESVEIGFRVVLAETVQIGFRIASRAVDRYSISTRPAEISRNPRIWSCREITPNSSSTAIAKSLEIVWQPTVQEQLNDAWSKFSFKITGIKI